MTIDITLEDYAEVLINATLYEYELHLDGLEDQPRQAGSHQALLAGWLSLVAADCDAANHAITIVAGCTGLEWAERLAAEGKAALAGSAAG